MEPLSFIPKNNLVTNSFARRVLKRFTLFLAFITLLIGLVFWSIVLGFFNETLPAFAVLANDDQKFVVFMAFFALVVCIGLLQNASWARMSWILSVFAFFLLSFLDILSFGRSMFIIGGLVIVWFSLLALMVWEPWSARYSDKPNAEGAKPFEDIYSA